MSIMEQKHLMIMMRQAQQPIFLSIGNIGQLDLPAFVNVCALLSCLEIILFQTLSL